jgi:pimeloyl-ACP methyl ester carboxylesterase
MTMNEKAAFNRARQLIPHLEAELFPKAGHILNMEQPEVVDARILQFLGQRQVTEPLGETIRSAP